MASAFGPCQKPLSSCGKPNPFGMVFINYSVRTQEAVSIIPNHVGRITIVLWNYLWKRLCAASFTLRFLSVKYLPGNDTRLLLSFFFFFLPYDRHCLARVRAEPRGRDEKKKNKKMFQLFIINYQPPLTRPIGCSMFETRDWLQY